LCLLEGAKVRPKKKGALHARGGDLSKQKKEKEKRKYIAADDKVIPMDGAVTSPSRKADFMLRSVPRATVENEKNVPAEGGRAGYERGTTAA